MSHDWRVSTARVQGRRARPATRRRPALDVLEDRSLPSGAALSLALASHAIAASAATTGTVTRSGTDNVSPLTVTLTDSNPAAATLPATVVIPAGQASATFNVAATSGGAGLSATVTGSALADTPLALDPSFLHSSQPFSTNAVAFTPTGQVVVAGIASSGTSPNYYDFGVARDNANGTPDTTFNGNGTVVVGLTSQSDKAEAVAVQPDGKIVVAGIDGNGPYYNFIVARYNTNGTLDTTFGNGGKTVIVPTSGYYNEVWALALQPNGQILVGGDVDNGSPNYDDFAVLRLNPNGTPDPGFGTGGIAQTSFSSGTDRGYALALQADGRIVVAGTSFDGNSTSAFALARFTPGGQLDPSFGSGGKVQTSLPGGYEQAKGVAIQPDGKIVAVGYVNNAGVYPPNANAIAVVRYNSNGTLDTTFGGGGFVLDHIAGNDKAAAVAIQPDGMIDVAAQAGAPNGSALLARFLPSGVLDGQVTAPSQGSYVAEGFQPGTNRLVVAGNNVANNLSGFLDGYSAFANVVASDTLTVTSATSPPPVASNDSYAVTKATALTVAAPGVLANDTDPNNLPLTATLVAGPAHGTVTLNANGSFTYTPTGLYLGTDSFTYKAFDGSSFSTVATVSLSVTGPDDPPTVGSLSSYVAENYSLNLPAPGVLNGASDPNGQPLTAILVSPPTHGTISFSANGAVTYTPATNYVGPDSFSFQVSDGTLLSNVATDSINVAPLYSSPKAVADTYSTNENQILRVSAPGVLGNDTDPNGLVPVPVVTSTTTHGTLTVNPDGSLTYAPNAYFHGIDQFNYDITDGHATSSVVTDTIFVNFVNYPPVAVNDSYSMVQNSTLTTTTSQTYLTMVSQPGDYIGQGQSYSFNAGNSTMLASRNFDNGVNFTLQSKDGTQSWFLDFAAPNNVPLGPGTYLGAARFPFEAAGQPGLSVSGDGRGSNTLTGQFTVTQALYDSSGNVVSFAASFVQHSEGATPALSGQISYNAMPPGVPAGVLANDSDPNGQALTARLAGPPMHGSILFNADGTFTYTPAPGYYGTDSFGYIASNGALSSNPAVVSIAVAPLPVANNLSYGVTENKPITVPAPSGVLSRAFDPDGDKITALLVAAPAHGSVQLSSDGSFVYTPAANYFGPDQFTFKASDGTLSSNVATASLVVNAPPTAVNQWYSTLEGQTLVTPAPGLLSGARDPDGDKLTAGLVAGPAHGTVAVNANGSFVYTPAANYFGPDQFTFFVSDGTLGSNVTTASILVQAPPTVVNQSYVTSENGTLSQTSPGLLAGSADPSGGLSAALSATLVAGPAHGTVVVNADGSFVYAPAANYFGPDQFTFKASDGTLTSNVATASIVVDAPPVAFNASYTGDEDQVLSVPATSGLLTSAGDPDGDPVTTALVSGPAHGSVTVNGDGSFVYTPAPGFFGTDSFTFEANDGRVNSNVATASIVVNAPPVATGIAYSVQENQALAVPTRLGVLTSASDPDGDPLTASLVSGPAHGTVTLNPDGSFVYTPAPGFFGTDTFTFEASDGRLNSNVATASVVVNAPPVATDVSFGVNEGQVLTVPAGAGVLASASDPDGDPLTAVLLSGPMNGSVTLNPDGSFVYTPAAGYSGIDSFTYEAVDGLVASNVATVSLAIHFVNQAPSFVAGPNQAVNEDAAAQAVAGWASGVSAGPPSESGQALDFLVGVDNAALFSVAPAIAPDGTLTYTPAPGVSGTATVTVQLHDDGGTANGGVDTSPPQTFTIAVNFVNQQPSFVASDPPPVSQDSGPQVVANWAAFNPGGPDEVGQAATYTVANVSSPALFSVAPAVDSSGTLTYTPAPGASGTSTFDVQVQDDGGTANGGIDTSTIQTFTIVITPAASPGGLAPNSASPASPSTAVNDAALASLGSNPSTSSSVSGVAVPDDLVADVAQPPQDPSKTTTTLV